MKRALYIPALGQSGPDHSVKAYAMRMMKALDENAIEEKNTYRVESSEREYDADGNVSSLVSIFQTNNKKEKEIYRFYEFRYGGFLTERFDASNVFYKFVTLLLVLITRFKSIFLSLFSFKDEVSKASKAQAFYFALIYIFLALYLITLIPALLALLIGFADGVEQLNFLVEPIKGYDSYVKAILASFSAFMLFKPDSKAMFSSMATEYLAANQYLSFGEQRLLIMGKLSRLIEFIAEENDNEFELEIHSYSFGSVIALDLMFPYESEASVRIQNSVTRLVTIGCPFDFLEIYWNSYFSDRKASGLSLKSWDNINSDLDVLSTEFSNRPAKQLKFIKSESFWKQFNDIDITYNLVNPNQVSILQMFLLYGLRAHRMYWDKNVDAKSCLFVLFGDRSAERDSNNP